MLSRIYEAVKRTTIILIVNRLVNVTFQVTL